MCLVLGAPTILLAQDAQNISVPPGPYKYPAHQVNASPDMMCNFAGTFSLQQFLGESNDTDLPQIFLCAGDSFLVRHNGDAILTGDPIPGTTPGVAYAYYACAPTVMGDNLQAISAIPGPGDPCILNVPPSANGLYITPSIPNGGDTWFFNSGGNISLFGLGQPVSIFFAPITLDEIMGTSGYESTIVGSPPGPCVNVNTNAAFEVIYLNPITQEGVSTSFGDDCLGKFTIRGGYPEYDNTAIYTITIALTSDPLVKAVIHTQQSQLFHLAPVIFSVPQAGNYTITVEDGKSCPASFTMDMSGCNPTDNVTLAFPDTIAPPSTTHFCVPLTVQNFDIVSSSFSINWDPAVLQYTGIENLNSVLDAFTGSTLNNANASLGQIGLIIYDLDVLGNVLSVPDNGSLFNVCFDIVGVLGQCSGLSITNNPTAVAFEDASGQSIALTSDTGSICIQFLPMDFQIAITDTTCLGTASMEVTATGGVAPYQYSVTVEEVGGPTYSGTIVGSGSTYTVANTIGNFNNLTNVYYVCVTDDNDVLPTICDTISVTIPTLGAQIDFVQLPTCNGADDGILNAVVFVGGVAVPSPGPNFTYLWTPSSVPDPTGPLQDGTVNGGVPSGNYTLIVTDTIRHCSSNPAQGFLGQPLPISEDLITLTQASCSGVSDGTINYLVEDGTPFPGGQYQYSWVDANNAPLGAPGQNNPIIINAVASGTYTVTITDANGCEFIDSVDITDQRVVTINQGVIQNVSCFGLSDGGATVTITESSPTGNAFQFTWSPPGGTQFNTNKSSAYSDLPIGSYFVTGQDAAGCKDTITVQITQPNELVMDTLSLLGPGCGAQNSGTITVIAQGGSGGPNYTYNWDNAGVGPTQNMLGIGIYRVTVTDVNGCKDSLEFTLFPPAPPAFTIDSVSVTCGNDGTLSVSAPTAVLYNWTAVPTAGSISDTTEITGLQGGMYAVTVTDAFSCTAVDTITLQGVTPLSFADTSFVLPLCFGDNDGIIGVTVQDGQIPYTGYNWSPGPQPNTPTIFALTAGIYDLTVTDNAGCTLTGSFTLAEPPQVVNTLSGIADVSCFGICDGTAQLVTNYATTPATTGNFIYIWSDGLSTSDMRTDLCAGTHIVTSADNNGCGDTDTITILSPPQVTATTTASPASCFGLTDGSATVLGAGGNGAPFTYLWSDPNSTTTPNVNNLAAGEYVVTVTDVDGCTSVIDSVFVTEPGELVLSTDPQQTSDPTCAGATDGFLVVTVAGGNIGQFDFEWSDDMGVIGNTPYELDSLPAGFYSVVVTDAQGCTSSLVDMVLMDPPSLTGSYEDPAALLCNGDVSILRIDTIVGGAGGPYQFSLDYGALLDIDFPVSLSGGEHYITYYDVRGCFYTDTIQVTEPAPIAVSFNPALVEIELGDTTYQLKPLITGAAVDSFIWTPAEFLHYGDTLTPYVYTFESQTYTLVVFDDKGCSGSGTVVVNVDPNRNVYVPNVFMPGVGRLDDHFNVYVGRGIEIVNYMRVYDRWGELMYAREKFLPNNDSAADGWDGKYNGDYVNPAVFVYIIEVKFLDGRVLLYRGDVTVVR